MKNLSGQIHGQRDISFIVTVEREEVSGAVECKVIGITKTVRDDFSARKIRLQSEQRSRDRILDGRCRHCGIRTCHAGKIPCDDVPPAIRSLLNRMHMMFTTSFDLHEDLRRPVGHIVFVIVAKDLDAFVSGTDQARAEKEHPLRSRGWLVRELFERVRLAIIV